MDKVFFFEFESRQWSSRTCKDVLPQWSFGHATKRGRSVFTVGSPRGETGTLEVPTLAHQPPHPQLRDTTYSIFDFILLTKTAQVAVWLAVLACMASRARTSTAMMAWRQQ